MDVDEVMAYASDRLGMRVQAAVRATWAGDTQGLTVWRLLTEHGRFYLVDGPAGCELVRATKLTQALSQYRRLHPESAGPASPGRVTFACMQCGDRVRTAPTTMLARDQLCPRCRRRVAQLRRYHEKQSGRAR